MKSQFSAISENLSRARALFDEKKFDDELALLNSSITTIIKSNYFPLLEPFLSERMKIAQETGDIATFCTDALLRADPHVRCPNPAAVFESYLSASAGKPETTVELEPHLQPLFPIFVRARYDCESCVAGSQPTVLISVSSKAEFPIDITSLSLVFGHDSAVGDETCEVSGPFKLTPHGASKFTHQRTLKPSVSLERIESVIVRIGCVSLKFSCDSPPLRILPDENACRIEYSLPKQCIVGAVLPVRVTLAAERQRLENLSVRLESEVRTGGAWEPTDLIVSASCGGKDITGGTVELGALAPGASLELEMSVKKPSPVFCRLLMTVAFSTELSGVGEFKKELTFDFVTPFTAQMRMYDSNYQELRPDNLKFEKGSEIYIETSCRNDMDFPITVLEVKSSMASVDCVDMPVVISPGEVFTFLGTVTEPGVADVTISYETELTGKCEYSGRTTPVVQLSRGVRFDFVSPATAVRHQEFEAEIVIDNTEGESDLASVMMIVDFQPSQGFFVNGPTKKMIPVFKGKKKVVPIKFFPLDAGSTTLPPIVLKDMGSTFEEKRFSAPIVVTFQ